MSRTEKPFLIIIGDDNPLVRCDATRTIEMPTAIISNIIHRVRRTDGTDRFWLYLQLLLRFEVKAYRLALTCKGLSYAFVAAVSVIKLNVALGVYNNRTSEEDLSRRRH